MLEIWIPMGFCGLAAAVFLYRMTIKSRVTHEAIIAQHAALSALDSDTARQRALLAIANWGQKRNTSGEIVVQLGVLTREFLSSYNEIVSPNEADRLGLNYFSPSQYRPGLWAIGTSDSWEICVLPGEDTVFVIDGSETEDNLCDLSDQYPSVFHFLADQSELYLELLGLTKTIKNN